jgi:hypothetical protein
MYTLETHSLCVHKLIIQDRNENNIWMFKPFIKKLRSSYKMEFVRTSYNLRSPISVSTAQGLSISWPMENFN